MRYSATSTCSESRVSASSRIEVDLEMVEARPGQPAGQAEVVEYGWPQAADHRAGLRQGEVDQVAGLLRCSVASAESSISTARAAASSR